MNVGTKYLMCLGISLVCLAGCSESLEDTYSDYAGNGKIRYIGKCSDLSLSPGWNRVFAEWLNSADAMIDKIQVSWEASGEKHDTLLSADATSCDIKNLVDDTYRIDVRALDKNGNISLAVTDYARPYTYDHEAVRSFSRIVSRHYEMEDKLIFCIDSWDNNIVEANLCYTSVEGNKEVYPLTNEIVDKGLVLVEDVDMQEPIVVSRKGRLEGCSDLICFADYELPKERIFSSDFKLMMQRRYGLSEKTEAQKIEFNRFVDTVTVLEFDYNVNSFEDILYCPKLERLVCGKNRYLSGMNPYPAFDESVCNDEKASLQALDLYNKLKGIRVEKYNNHYFSAMRPYIVLMGNPILPELDYISREDIASIVDLSMEGEEESSNLYSLLDNNPQTWWEPSIATSPRTHELLITLAKSEWVSGIKVVQRLYTRSTSQKYYVSDKIVIEVSADKSEWEPLSWLKENPIGIGSGEATLIPMSEPREIRYVKVTLSDKMRDGTDNYNMTLSGLTLYK